LFEELTEDEQKSLKEKQKIAKNSEEYSASIQKSMDFFKNHPKKPCPTCGNTFNTKTHQGPCSLGCSVALEQRMKIELNQRNSQIAQLKDKLDNRVKKILDLKYQLRQEREQEHIRRRHEEYKASI
jgi:hypothetical protein